MTCVPTEHLIGWSATPCSGVSSMINSATGNLKLQHPQIRYSHASGTSLHKGNLNRSKQPAAYCVAFTSERIYISRILCLHEGADQHKHKPTYSSAQQEREFGCTSVCQHQATQQQHYFSVTQAMVQLLLNMYWLWHACRSHTKFVSSKSEPSRRLSRRKGYKASSMSPCLQSFVRKAYAKLTKGGAMLANKPRRAERPDSYRLLMHSSASLKPPTSRWLLMHSSASLGPPTSCQQLQHKGQVSQTQV